MALRSYAEALKTDKNLNEYIKQRKGLDKSSNEYKVLQNKINEAYGSSKRYKVDIEAPTLAAKDARTGVSLKPTSMSGSAESGIAKNQSIPKMISRPATEVNAPRSSVTSDPKLKQNFGSVTDTQRNMATRMASMLGGDSKGSSTGNYQSATTHTDATGTTITNLKGIPGQTRDRAIVGVVAL